MNVRIVGTLLPLLVTACGTSEPLDVATRSAIEVTMPAATVVVDRDPFRLRFLDAHGAAVLSQVENTSAAPMPIAAVAEPAPFGGELPKTPSLYSPLSFVVGAQALPQIPAGPWEANALTGTAAGIAYHATRVERVTQHAGRTELEVATNDPTGRVLRVTLSPVTDGSVRVQVRPQPETGIALMSDAFVATHDTAFRGFGGRHNALDQRGHDFLGWIMQQNFGAGVLQPIANAVPGGDRQYLFPNGKTAAYYVAPSFVAPRYGFLLERDELSRWRMASDRGDAWQVQVAAPALDYSVHVGAPPQTIASMTSLTGRHRPPPAWALGPILDRATIAFTQDSAQYEAQVRDDLAQIDATGARVSGYRIEGWFKLVPEVRAELINEFKARGIRTLTYFRAFSAIDGAGTEDADVFLDALASDYVADTLIGTPYLFGGNFMGPSVLIDFTDPDAVAWWKDRIKAALDEGADGFMQDFGEQVMGDMAFDDGQSGIAFHNRYPVVYHRITREAIDEWLLEHPGRDDIWFFTRTGWAGIDGSARYEGSNFAGDGNTDWSPSSGLASQAPDMLSRGIAGAYGFTTDIGGYFDYISAPTTRELFIRWAQWAVLSPLMRLHGSVRVGTHMPWTYDEETVAIWNALCDLRLRAAPYIAQAWQHAHETGMPIARPLWLVFPDEPQAAHEMQQWMLGDDVLVAPVVEEGATSRSVYFPQGCWTHGERGEQFEGPARIDVAAPLDSLPYFFRCESRPF